MKTDSSTDRWLHSSRGQALCQAERDCVYAQSARLFGRSLLQIGSWSQDLLPLDPQWRSGVLGPHGTVDVRCDLAQLPLAGRSVDGLLLAHSLESADSAHQLLREADRVLSLRGQLLILAFNPWSLWGLSQQVLRRHSTLPEGMRPLSQGRVQDWLRLLDYEVLDSQRISPVRRTPAPWLKPAWPWLTHVLNWFAPVYLIRARKRRLPINPAQRPVWGRAAAGMDTVGMPTRSGSARVVVPLHRGEPEA